MISDYDHILAKSVDSGGQTLASHLNDVATVAIAMARNLGIDETAAWYGGLLHDIGKSSPLFQKTLKPNYIRKPNEIYRHEIGSLFFISLVPESIRTEVLEMIVSHHKSIYNDSRGMGMLDLDDEINSFEIHSQYFNDWSVQAIGLLNELGMETRSITIEEARYNYDYALTYCSTQLHQYGCSRFKGLLMAADHYASAFGNDALKHIDKLFIKPDLTFYERSNSLFPLSLMDANDSRPHTLVVAPTGAGKTDFLLRRCRSRVFYTLPFQASINAMYERLKNDLKHTNAQISLLHASSSLVLENGDIEDSILQRQIGLSIKVMTPHQMASIAFGIKGYESLIIDLLGQDVILDEIHTYSGATQAIVLKIIEVLVSLKCRVHIGTATMPTLLYERIKDLLGGSNNVYELSISPQERISFDRHIIYKVKDFESSINFIDNALLNNQKILIICNKINRAQDVYKNISDTYPQTKRMLLHSRFKRCDRNLLESRLKEEFDKSDEACIVVSTQVVEVSLDINFDIMITECAPIDAMIQRFGRINRKRTAETIGLFKPIYVIAPQEGKEALPYQEDVLRRSYEVIPNGEVLHENDIQEMIDQVYPDTKFLDLTYSGTVFVDGEWNIPKLCHNAKAAFCEALDIQTVPAILETDEDIYRNGHYRDVLLCEIPCRYHAIAHNNLNRLEIKRRPFVLPANSYSKEMGLQLEKVTIEAYNNFEIL